MAADDERAGGPTPTSSRAAATSSAAAGAGTAGTATDHAAIEPLPLFGDLRPVEPGRYDLVAEHGRGGLGTVMRAFDRQLGRVVALKLLQNPTPSARARFIREATITSRLQHPSIVTVLDVVRWVDGTPCYTMPLYPGRSLKEAIAAAPALGERLALLPNALAVAEAVAHAHERRILHRDLKPSNVLLGALGETVVIDWGLAKRLEDADEPAGAAPAAPTAALDSDAAATRTGAVLGTPAYMAPEQARGEPVDCRADVYALGALLYHVVAGHPPYHGDSASVLARLLAEPPPPLASLAPGAPLELRAIVAKAMARAPTDRYADAGLLAADLRRFLQGALVEAHAYTRGQLVGRWLRRHRALVTASSLALAAVVAVTAASFDRIRRERGLARAAAAREKARADALILTQAETELLRDPTRAVAWLKTYPLDGADWAGVRAIARDAAQRGVARWVVPRSGDWSYAMITRDRDRRLLSAASRRSLDELDLETGARRVVCLPGELLHGLRDDGGEGDLVLAFTDGRVLALAADLGRQDMIAEIPGLSGVTSSSDGRWVVATRTAGPAVVFDRTGGTEHLLTAGAGDVASARFVPGSSRVVLQDRAGGVEIVDVASGQLLHVAPPRVREVVISRHGRHVVLLRSGVVEWVDTQTWQTAAIRSRVSFFSPIDLFPDGRVAIAERDKRIVLWDPLGASSRIVALTSGNVAAVAPAGDQVASFDDGGSLLTEVVATGERRRLLVGHNRLARQLRFAGKNLAGLSEGSPLQVWPGRAERSAVVPLGAPRFSAPITDIAGGREVLAGAQDGRVLRLAAAQPPRELARLPGPVTALAATDEGTVVVAVSAGRLWRLPADPGAPARALFAGLPELWTAVLSPSGRYAAALPNHGEAGYWWDLEAGTQNVVRLEDSTCQSIDWVGERLLLSCSGELGRPGFRLIDPAGGPVLVLAARSSELHYMGQSPAARYVFGGSNDRLYRWDLATGERAERRLGVGRWTSGMAVGEDLLVAARAGFVFLVHFGSGLELELGRAELRREAMASSRSGLVAGSDTNGAAYVWDLLTAETWTLGSLATIRPLVVTRDGSLYASGEDGNVHVLSRPLGPATPEATRAWLDELTDFSLDRGGRPATCQPSENQ